MRVFWHQNNFSDYVGTKILKHTGKPKLQAFYLTNFLKYSSHSYNEKLIEIQIQYKPSSTAQSDEV